MPLEPVLMTIFGTTGDLAKKKLYPALFALHQSGRLDDRTTLIGVGRRDWDDQTYRESVIAAVRLAEAVDAAELADFASRFHYYRMDMNQATDYTGFWHFSDQLADARSCSHNRLYFLATAPDLFPMVSQMLGKEQPARPGHYRRIMIEKPFGRDLESARHFNTSLRAVFAEDEIYRIDHYLGKAMLQNILVLRFDNSLFEPAWRKSYIDHIQISVTEPFGIEQRSGYYDQSGALRDMVQSHLLQLLALLTMECPADATPESVRDEKVRLFRSIRPYTAASAPSDVVLGQYGGDSRIRSYLDEPGIGPDSRTETFAALKLWIDNERWQGVPVYLRTGKRMDRYVAKITLVFRSQTWHHERSGDDRNTIVIRIQPEEGIDLRFNIKQPGMNAEITQAHMNICQSCSPATPSPQAYEKLIYDAMAGDLALFTRWDEIEATWTLIDSIQNLRSQLPVFIYQPGSEGPAAAELMLRRDGRHWLDL